MRDRESSSRSCSSTASHHWFKSLRILQRWLSRITLINTWSKSSKLRIQRPKPLSPIQTYVLNQFTLTRWLSRLTMAVEKKATQRQEACFRCQVLNTEAAPIGSTNHRSKASRKSTRLISRRKALSSKSRCSKCSSPLDQGITSSGAFRLGGIVKVGLGMLEAWPRCSCPTNLLLSKKHPFRQP